MKIVKIILLSFLVLILVVVIAAIVLIKTFDINRYKPQIIAQINTVLNRPVDFRKANLSISLTQGISLKVEDLVIAEDPVFQKGNFLSVKEISLGVDVLGYFSKKVIRVPSIRIDTPRVVIIRQKDGSLNVSTLVKPSVPGGTTQKPAVATSTPAVTPPSVAAPVAIPAVLISSLLLENGIISYVDHSFEPALAVDIVQLKIEVDNISLTKPFRFVAEGTILGTQKNVKAEGLIQIDSKTGGVVVKELKVDSDLSAILLDRIPKSFPMVPSAVLPELLKGKASGTFSEVSADATGLKKMDGSVYVKEGVLQFKEVSSSLSDIVSDVKVTLTKIFLDKLSATFAEGTIAASGAIDDYLVKQDFSGDLDIKNLKIQDIMPEGKIPVKVEGLLSAVMKLSGQGFAPEALTSTLAGSGTIMAKQVVLKDINVLRLVLDKLSVIPGLNEKISSQVSEKYQKKLEQKDTYLQDINLPISIAHKQISIKEVVIGADEFVFKGEAQAGFNGSYAFEGSFVITKEFSEMMLLGAPELKYLLNENKEIFFPIKVSGNAQGMKFSVDAAYITKKLVVNQAESQLGKVIDKAIGGTEGSGQKIVGEILGTIFKK